MDTQHHHQHAHQHDAESEGTAMAELLDLDAEVLHTYLSELTAWVEELSADRPPRRILDVGSGSGTGTFALLRRFGGAEVIAMDVSAPMLHHLGARARDLGVTDRVHTVEADLDAAWPALDDVDLVWASASMHHMADPHRALTEVAGALRPGGLLVVVELGSIPRFLPDDLGVGRPGLEARCHTLMADANATQVPHLGADWGPHLTAAGFTVEAERVFAIDLAAPLPAAAGRYAQSALRRMRAGLTGLTAEDLATLDLLLDSDGPDGLLRRDDLVVRTTRTVWVARRP
jgi:SAM-dependent methyltransferase